MITKAIIPVAGWGTRRLPITKVLEKSMLPVGNRPLVDYSVQELIAAGITDIYMVISDTEPCQVKKFYEENSALTDYLTERGKTDALALARTLPDGVKIHYTVQDPSAKYGTAVPIALVVEKYQINEPVLVFMGDDFIWNPGGQSASEALLSAGGAPPAPVNFSTTSDSTSAISDNSNVPTTSSTSDSNFTSAILGVEIDPAAVASYGVLSVENGCLTGIVEKPQPTEAPSNLINVSKYLMTPDLLQDICAYVQNNNFAPGEREYMVTDPIANYIARGGIIKVAPTTGEFLDGGTLTGWLHANEVVCSSTGLSN